MPSNETSPTPSSQGRVPQADEHALLPSCPPPEIRKSTDRAPARGRADARSREPGTVPARRAVKMVTMERGREARTGTSCESAAPGPCAAKPPARKTIGNRARLCQDQRAATGRPCPQHEMTILPHRPSSPLALFPLTRKSTRQDGSGSASFANIEARRAALSQMPRLSWVLGLYAASAVPCFLLASSWLPPGFLRDCTADDGKRMLLHPRPFSLRSHPSPALSSPLLTPSSCPLCGRPAGKAPAPGRGSPQAQPETQRGGKTEKRVEVSSPFSPSRHRPARLPCFLFSPSIHLLSSLSLLF
ncbi:hypothetical protein CDD83_1406 [Cordyceps sp. RAO-2017]|nr:hypothetical protein CDD83_1406 [Cordyceps sp. RAO-2017]